MTEEIIPMKKVDVAEVFGIETKMEVFAFEHRTDRVPEVESSYVFDNDTTLSILAGFSKNRRVMVQGYHCLLYTSPSPRDAQLSRMPSSA